MITESFASKSLPTVAPAYLYSQYSDDPDLTAFVASQNTIMQGFIDWFNNTPLGLYTSNNISGELLDWIANGVYGIARPYLSTTSSSTSGSINTFRTNNRPVNLLKTSTSGTTQIVDDDIYKRVITWFTYRGDGYHVNMQWVKRRIARFIYGANGSDISLDDIYNISVNAANYHSVGANSTFAVNTMAVDTMLTTAIVTKHSLSISVPYSQVAESFQTLLASQYITLPFQIKFTVTLT